MANQHAAPGGESSVEQSREGSLNEGKKSRQGAAGFVRTYKASKSRQADDLDRPFGTERVSFHKSSLVNGQTQRQAIVTQQESSGVPAGYKRPLGSVNKNAAAGTVRVQSHSQPPLSNK